jgi:hypothetical protein
MPAVDHECSEFVPVVITFTVVLPKDAEPDPAAPPGPTLEPNRITGVTFSRPVAGVSVSFTIDTVTLDCNANGDLIFPKSITWTNHDLTEGHAVGGPSLLPAGAALTKFTPPSPQIIDVLITVHFLRGEDNTDHTLWVRYDWATSNAALKLKAPQSCA